MDDKRPLLSSSDKRRGDKDDGASVGPAASQGGPTGPTSLYGTLGESSGARIQNPDTSTSKKEVGNFVSSQSTPAPTAASIGHPIGNPALTYSRALSINLSPEEAVLPIHTSQTGLSPVINSQGHSNKQLLSNSFPGNYENSADLSEDQDQGRTARVSQAGGLNYENQSSETPERTSRRVSSRVSASHENKLSRSPSAPSFATSDRHPLNIKNKIKQPPSSRSTGTSQRDTAGERDKPLYTPEPNMEHAAHIRKAKNGSAVIDKDEKTHIFVYVLACFATIGGLLFGYDTGIVSGSMLLIKSELHLSNQWVEYIVSATIASACVFSIFAGFTCDFFGRKLTIMAASVVFVIGAVFMGASQNKEMLLVGRIIVGIGIGFASMAVPIYVAEAAPPNIRGRLVTINQLFITIGILISSIIAGAFSYLKPDGWRYMLGLAGVPAIVQFVGFLFLPESPRWLVMKGREAEAWEKLRQIRGKIDVQDEMNEIKEVIEEDKQFKGMVLGRVFSTPHVRKALFVGCGLQLFQQLCGINTVIYYSGTILKMAGFPPEEAIWLVLVPNGVNFLSTIVGVMLVERLGRKKLMLGSLVGVLIALIVLAVGFQLSANFSPNLYNITEDFDPYNENTTDHCVTRKISTCEQCIENTDCGFCYMGDAKNGTCLYRDKDDEDIYSSFGRCNRTNKSALGMTFSHEFCPTDYSWMAVLGLALFVMSFAPGLGPMPWTINSEIYPLWARSTSISLATGCNWVCNLLVSLFFLTLTEAITKYGAFWLFGGICFLGFFFSLIFLPETKNKTLEEVEDLFKGKKVRGSDNLGYERDIPDPDSKSNTRL